PPIVFPPKSIYFSIFLSSLYCHHSLSVRFMFMYFLDGGGWLFGGYGGVHRGKMCGLPGFFLILFPLQQPLAQFIIIEYHSYTHRINANLLIYFYVIWTSGC